MLRTLARSTDRFERKREAILDASTELLNTHGVRGLTLAAAAAAVGLSTTSVTYYFKRKDELAGACMMRGIAALEAMVEAALSEPTPDARLRRLLALYLDRARQAEIGVAAPMPILADLGALNPPVIDQVFHAYAKLFRRLRQLFDAPGLDWLSRGRRTARTHLLIEQLFWAAAWLPKYRPEDYAAVGEKMYDILRSGIAAEGASWDPVVIPPAELLSRDRQTTGRETFLLAATRLINKRGYRGASVDKISAELNVTKGSFYHHNEAKDDLVVACFERTFEVLRQVQSLAASLPGDHWRKLSSVAATLAEFQLSEYGPMLRSSALAAIPDPIRSQMLEESGRISDGFATMIAKGIAEGSLRPVDPFIAAHMLNAAVNAASELSFWVPGLKQKAAPAIFARPMLTGLFSR